MQKTHKKDRVQPAPLDNIIHLAKDFIGIYSTHDNKKGLEDIIALAEKQLPEYTIQQFRAGNKPSILVHAAEPNTKKFKIILNAHLDVVPGKDGQFTPRVQDDKLFGRGAYDMKAAAAVMLLLFKEMAKQVKYPLALQLVTDEELVHGLGTYVQLQNGVKSEFAVIGECSSNLDIIFGSKGIFHATITTSGVTSHGAYPWNGKNAITKMHEVIGILQKHFPTPYTKTFETTINISQITTTNNIWNQTPDNCTITLDIRINHNEYGTILDKITSLLPAGVLFEVVKTRSPHYTDPNNKYISLLANAVQQITEKEPRKRKTYGGSDATFFSEMQLNAIEFGPIGQYPHHDGEWVDINSLGNYYQILKQFLLSVQ